MARTARKTPNEKPRAAKDRQFVTALARGLDILRGVVDISIQCELNRYLRCAKRADRRHGIDAGNCRELAFERRGNGCRRDLDRTGLRAVCVHDHRDLLAGGLGQE